MGLRQLLQEQRAVTYQSVWGTGGDWMPGYAASYDTSAALGLPAVIACVRHRANLINQLPINVVRYDNDGYSVPVESRFIERPCYDTLRSIWTTQMMISRDIWGNAFGLITARDASGYPTNVNWLFPGEVGTRQDFMNGPVIYTVNGQYVPNEDILLVPSTFNIPGSPLGMAPLQNAGLVDLAKTAQDYGAAWFRNGAVPSVVIYSDAELNEQQATDIRNRATSSWRNRRPAVLGAGLKVEAIKVDSNEAKFQDTVSQAGLLVTQVFGVDPTEVGMAPEGGKSLTYANHVDRKQSALDRMNSDIVVVQEAFTDQIPRGQFVKLNTGAYLMGDLKSRYESYKVGVEAGVITDDEARKLEDRRPLTAKQREQNKPKPAPAAAPKEPDKGDTNDDA